MTRLPCPSAPKFSARHPALARAKTVWYAERHGMGSADAEVAPMLTRVVESKYTNINQAFGKSYAIHRDYRSYEIHHSDDDCI